jgi:hypothetical protein
MLRMMNPPEQIDRVVVRAHETAIIGFLPILAWLVSAVMQQS